MSRPPPLSVDGLTTSVIIEVVSSLILYSPILITSSTCSFGLFAVVSLGFAISLLLALIRSVVRGVLQQVDKPALDGASIDLTTWPMSSCLLSQEKLEPTIGKTLRAEEKGAFTHLYG